MINENDDLIVIGTATASSKVDGIKSPYISIYDAGLNKIDNYNFPCSTTALNPKIEKLFDGSQILSYYKAESENIQTEHSHLIFLDEKFNKKAEKTFGHRTRIESLKALDKKFISYQYEREKLNTSVSIFQDSVVTTNQTFALSKESNIPTDLLIKNDSSIYISGIANGFHHRDGHQYINQSAYAYILKLDDDLNVQDSLFIQSEHHTFVNDLLLMEGKIIATGTQQNDTTGMDAVIQCLDENLNVLWSYRHKKNNSYRGIKTLKSHKYIYVLCEAHDPMINNSNVHLLQLKLDGTYVNEIILQSEESYQAKDFLIHKDQIYIVATKQKSRTSPMQSVIIKLDDAGKILSEKQIE